MGVLERHSFSSEFSQLDRQNRPAGLFELSAGPSSQDGFFGCGRDRYRTLCLNRTSWAIGVLQLQGFNFTLLTVKKQHAVGRHRRPSS